MPMIAVKVNPDAEQLRANLTKLRSKDQDFAKSLLAQADSGKVLSYKQQYWIGELARKATNVVAPQVIPLDSFQRVYDLFAKASKKLKQPKLIFQLPSYRIIRLKMAGPASRLPGVINIVDIATNGWYGRIHPEGRWERNTLTPPDEVVDAIRAIAEDPEKVLGENGKKMGRCCFCLMGLTDQRSTEVGYGPVCARNYGLNWGVNANALDVEKERGEQ